MQLDDLYVNLLGAKWLVAVFRYPSRSYFAVSILLYEQTSAPLPLRANYTSNDEARPGEEGYIYLEPRKTSVANSTQSKRKPITGVCP